MKYSRARRKGRVSRRRVARHQRVRGSIETPGKLSRASRTSAARIFSMKIQTIKAIRVVTGRNENVRNTHTHTHTHTHIYNTYESGVTSLARARSDTDDDPKHDTVTILRTTIG